VQAKNQILFKENDEFVATQFGMVKRDAEIPTEEVAPKFLETQDYKAKNFALTSDFLNVLYSDKAIAAEIDRIVSTELAQRIFELEEKNKITLQSRLAELEEIQKAEVESKRREGLEQGLREGKIKADLDSKSERERWTVEVEELKEAMKKWTDGFHTEREALLNEHKVYWLELISIVMRKFLVPHSGQIKAGIEDWFNHQLDVFKSEEKIKVLIPPHQFECLQKNRIETNIAGLEFVQEPALKNNEFKVETRSGGVFFSAEEQVQRLGQMIKDMFTTGD